eukprot:3209368-Pyramimonas_sp.AAC.1
MASGSESSRLRIRIFGFRFLIGGLLACQLPPIRLLPTRPPITGDPIRFDRRSDLSVRFWALLGGG